MSTAEPKEFPSSSAPLLAASFLLESDCKSTFDTYMKCRSNHTDPSDCQHLAHNTLDCTSNLYQHYALLLIGDRFRKVAHSKCRGLFERFWKCLDYNNQDFIYCRQEEFDFEDCAKEQLGIEKRLWVGVHPKEGLKGEKERPEVDHWQYQLHVLTNKVNPPNS